MFGSTLACSWIKYLRCQLGFYAFTNDDLLFFFFFFCEILYFMWITNFYNWTFLTVQYPLMKIDIGCIFVRVWCIKIKRVIKIENGNYLYYGRVVKFIDSNHFASTSADPNLAHFYLRTGGGGGYQAWLHMADSYILRCPFISVIIQGGSKFSIQNFTILMLNYVKLVLGCVYSTCSLLLTVPYRLNQTGSVTFSSLPFWTFCRDTYLFSILRYSMKQQENMIG
jgi:hypothetical protein